MNQLRPNLTHLARVLLVLIFLINGFGIVTPAMATHDMVQRGVPSHLAGLLCIAGRIVDVVAGFGLIFGVYRRLCALALIALLISATLIAHTFWSAPSALYQIQLVNFFKNISLLGGLLFIACHQSKPEEATDRASTATDRVPC